MNFMKKLFKGEVDDSVHNQLIRFGKGVYGGRAPISIWKAKKVKLKAGFEFANDFVIFASGLGTNFQGIIWSKDPLEGLAGDKKSGKYVYEVSDFSSDQVRSLIDKAYYFLLDGEAEGVKLKIKKKLPKPGKSEDKIDDKFCQMELDLKYFDQAKENFFWDVGDCKKAKAKHEYNIEGIVMPKTEEKDFAKIREMAKRKGKLVRTIDCDGSEIKKEIDFEA